MAYYVHCETVGKGRAGGNMVALAVAAVRALATMEERNIGMLWARGVADHQEVRDGLKWSPLVG